MTNSIKHRLSRLEAGRTDASVPRLILIGRAGREHDHVVGIEAAGPRLPEVIRLEAETVADMRRRAESLVRGPGVAIAFTRYAD